MEVVVSAEAKEFVHAHGGVVFVRPHGHRCCHGLLTVLDVTTELPANVDEFIPVETDDIAMWFRGDSVQQPDVVTIELRGVLRRRLVASWDGCAFKMM
jgi:hypothetical protein